MHDEIKGYMEIPEEEFTGCFEKWNTRSERELKGTKVCHYLK